MNFKSLISNINSWNDFKSHLEGMTKLEKGQAFEELTKYYLQHNPVYRTKLKNVWLQREIPSSVIKRLDLPSNDQGIDLIAETVDDSYWAIQCKYLQDEDQRLSHRAISTFVSLSTGIAKNITYCLVCTTVDEYAKIYKGKANIGFCNSDEWRKLDRTFFDLVRHKLKGEVSRPKPREPKPHQKKALREAKKYFLKERNSRGKLIFPCGSGKSLTGYWIAEMLKPKSMIVAVPSLSLVKQTLEVYLSESLANNNAVEWLCVCSDEGIGKNDDVVVHTNEIGVPCVTDKAFIARWLKEHSKKKTIVFTTYQSGKSIADACRSSNHKFDLGILDEAHKTVGDKDRLFSYLLFDKNIKIGRRVFMTATERRYQGSSDEILSMHDERIYGETFATLSYKEAINERILSDYKIVTLFISDKQVEDLIQKNAFVKPIGKEWDKQSEARALASLIALRKAMKKYPIHHAVTFHSSIKKAAAFEESQSTFSNAYPQYGAVSSFHVSGAMPTSYRSKIVDEFADSQKAVITNAKCLTEGVDVPNIDCVLFADPRKSTVDIVQAVGRALRWKQGRYGYVILPVFTQSKFNDEIVKSSEYVEILTVLRALASNDERIIDYFRDVSKGIKVSIEDSPIQFDIDVNLAENINEKDLLEKLELTTWSRLAKLSWRPFEEAREFVQSLGLNGQSEWNQYRKSGKKPVDISSNPNRTYKHNGWKGWGDWLGTGTIATHLREYKTFKEARKFVHSLGLRNRDEWNQYCKSGKKPDDISSHPNRTYRNNGWNGMGDWLGTGTIASRQIKYRQFISSREFVHKLRLRSRNEWIQYCMSGKKPNDIPAKPDRTYRVNGWKGMGDWLGTGTIAPRLIEYKAFNEARKFVHSLGLRNRDEWNQYCKSGEKPKNIPSYPNQTYKDKGWKGMGDWLGTGVIATKLKEFKKFSDAKEFVHSLRLRSNTEWIQYCKSGEKPEAIPANPYKTYRNKGWKGMGDWLGTGVIAKQLKEFRSFNDARQFVHTLNLTNESGWRKYNKSGKKPEDIPANPNKTYRDKGWKGMRDWLGTEKK